MESETPNTPNTLKKKSKSSSLEPINVTLYGKRDFVDVIELMVWRWGDYSGLSHELYV